MKQYLKDLITSLLAIPLLLASFCAVAQTGVTLDGSVSNYGFSGWGVGTGANSLDVTGPYDAVAGAATDYFYDPAAPTGTAMEISGSVAPAFYDAVFDNGTSATMQVSNAAGIDVANNLQLLNGITTSGTTVAGAIRLGATATTAGSASFGTNRYIDGYVGKDGSTAFTYPLGNAGIYSPITFSDPAGTAVRYLAANPGTSASMSTSQGALNLATVSSREYFPLSSAAATASSVTLPYGNFGPTDYVTDPSALTIAGWNGTAWVNLGSLGNTIDVGGQTVTISLNQSLAGFTQLALASTSFLNPLPVTLVSFSGVLANCTAIISWKTATELNSKSYIIEHSADGVRFEKTGEVASLNRANGSSYTFTDRSINSGINYYRLKMIDANGTATTSNTFTLRSNCGTPITVWPNPAKDLVKVAGLSGRSTIMILDATGRRMISVIAASTTVDINVGRLAAGAYTVLVVNENGTQSNVKLIKAK